MSANFVGNILAQSEAIETYTPYDVTSSRPRKTTTAFFANFGGIEKLFCGPDQSLNSKNIESVQPRLKFCGIEKGPKISFHRHFKERGKPEYPEKNLSEQSREPATNSTQI